MEKPNSTSVSLFAYMVVAGAAADATASAYVRATRLYGIYRIMEQFYIYIGSLENYKRAMLNINLYRRVTFNTTRASAVYNTVFQTFSNNLTPLLEMHYL